MRHFASYSVAAALKPDAFAHLDKHTRAQLVRLMARIAEKAYRRGVQHGATLTKSPLLRDDLSTWRYRPGADLSPWADSPTTTTSVHRLFSEHGVVLHQLGFEEPEEARLGYRSPNWTGYTPQRQRAIKQQQETRP